MLVECQYCYARSKFPGSECAVCSCTTIVAPHWAKSHMPTRQEGVPPALTKLGGGPLPPHTHAQEQQHMPVGAVPLFVRPMLGTISFLMPALHQVPCMWSCLHCVCCVLVCQSGLRKRSICRAKPKLLSCRSRIAEPAQCKLGTVFQSNGGCSAIRGLEFVTYCACDTILQALWLRIGQSRSCCCCLVMRSTGGMV